jgi:putative membrane protein
MARMLSAQVPAPWSGAWLTLWSADPLAILGCSVAGWCYGRWTSASARRGRPIPRWRRVCFYAGIALTLVALVSPVDRYADVSFGMHTVQHLLLTLAAPSLLALGRPVTAYLRGAEPNAARRVSRAFRSRPIRWLAHPFAGLLLFVGAVALMHFSGLYEAALRSWGWHVAEHAMLLGAGLAFWWSIVAADPMPHSASHPVRILALLVAMPAGAFTALAIASARAPLYEGYAFLPSPWGPAALADQETGAVMMWLVDNLWMLGAMLLVAAAWKRHEDRQQARLEAREPVRRPSAASP